LELPLLASALRLAAPLLLAALGGVLAERSGVIDVGLEGKLLFGAFTAAWAALATGDPWIGVAAGAAGGAALGFVHATFGALLRGDQIVVGVAINLLALGLTQFLLRVLYGTSANSPQLPGLPALPGTTLSPLVLAALLAVPAVHFVLHRTRFGLRIRAVGERPDACASLGVDPLRVRLAAVCLGGALAGIGGAYLALDTAQFVKNMSAGRGFLALAAVIFGKWTPLGAAGACLFFGAAEALQIRLQGAAVPTQFVQMTPYVLTMVALAGLVGRSRPPAALGTPWTGER
jgi:simple sugar transport system permease protein